MDISFLIVLGLMGISFGITIMISNQNKQRRLAEKDRQEQSKREQYSTLTTTKCPECAEEIKLEAKICRYCRADVSQNNATHLEAKTTEIEEFERKNFAEQLQKELAKKYAGRMIFATVLGWGGFVPGAIVVLLASTDLESQLSLLWIPIASLIGLVWYFSVNSKFKQEKQERIRLWEEGRKSN